MGCNGKKNKQKEDEKSHSLFSMIKNARSLHSRPKLASIDKDNIKK